MDNSDKKMIYVADDEANIRDLIGSFLINSGFQVELFESGDRLLERFLLKPCDLLVLDIMMPGTDGLALCRKIREKSSVPIIIVSARDSEFDRITGIAIGSDDYLVKPFSPVELITRIQAIFRRMNYLKEEAPTRTTAEANLEFGGVVISPKTREVKERGELIELSPLEYDFLQYLFKNADRAVSREELLRNVWDFDLDIDTRATDDLVKRLRKKLLNSKIRITAVWGYGFKLEKEDEKND